MHEGLYLTMFLMHLTHVHELRFESQQLIWNVL